MVDKNEKEKIPHCLNNSKIKYQNRRKRQSRYPYHTHIHDRSLSSLGAGTSIKSGGVKLVVWVQASSFGYFLIIYFLLRSNKNVNTESVNF